MLIKNKQILNNEKIVYLDIIRILACFMVIINHTNGYILNKSNFLNITFYCLTFALCKIGVPLFFMITGALTLDKNYSLKKAVKSIFRVLMPVLFLSIVLYIKNVGFSNFNFIYFIKSIIDKPYIAPYWYVYALIGVYLVIPFLQKMIKNFKFKDYKFFVILFLLVPTFINYIFSYLNININYNIFSAFFSIIISILICGSYISKIKINKKHFVISIFTFFISYILMFLSLYLPYLSKSQISYKLDSWNAFPVIIMSISIFIIVKYLFADKKMSNKVINIIELISSTTFGIYLIHYLLNYKLYNLGIIKFLFNFNPILGIIILDILVFVVSGILTFILKKIPIIKNYL